MNTQNNFEVPKIDSDEFFDGLFKTDETYGELWARLNNGSTNCYDCPFKEKCDKVFKIFDDKDIEFYCEDSINIMVGQKRIEDFL